MKKVGPKSTSPSPMRGRPSAGSSRKNRFAGDVDIFEHFFREIYFKFAKNIKSFVLGNERQRQSSDPSLQPISSMKLGPKDATKK